MSATVVSWPERGPQAFQISTSFPFTNEQKPNGELLVVRLRARKLPLEVAVSYRVYDGQAAVQKQLSIRNLGSKAVRISRLSVEAIAPSLGPENEIVLDAGYGTTQERFSIPGAPKTPPC